MSQLMFLLLEDSLFDAELIQALITEGGITCEIIQTKTGGEFENALLENCFDLILSDYSLPGFDGIAALEIAQRICPHTPFIFVTATMGEEVAIETLKSGATDYVLKQRLERLLPSIKRALREDEERRARQHAENELQRRDREFYALVENIPDIILRYDKNFRTLYVNPAVTQITGFAPEFFLNKTPAEQGYPKSVYLPWLEEMKLSFAQKQRRLFEFELACVDGTHYLDVKMVPELNSNGEVDTLLAVIRDITTIKQAEIKLREQKEELEELNRIKDEFLAILSHELRSPLNAILGWSKIISSRSVDAATLQKAIETIERNAKLQTQLIEDLLDISRIISGKLTLHQQQTNLIPVIEAAIATMGLAAEAKSIDFKFSISDEPWQSNNSATPNDQNPATNDKFIVLGDSNRLQQIVWNLLSNAIKFTPSNGKVEIILEQIGKQTTQYVQITVRDTGVGIIKDFIPHVFDSFRQADGSITRKYGGLGLGLAIVRQLVELHGGTVTVSSPGENQGATFVVKIPVINEEK
ncbi:MAG: response regulator [Methylacidiphilales bacterium]|nr:response regulator [Candidatus Methylacidiphilales bacterium]NJR17524.1 response regulator [Calothrix sp. CSU_2_0]